MVYIDCESTDVVYSQNKWREWSKPQRKLQAQLCGAISNVE